MARADYLELIRDAVGGVSFEADQIDRALAQAIWRYSKDRPRCLAWVIVSDDGRTVPLPPEWADTVSEISHIAAAVDGEVPLELTAADWGDAITPQGRVVRFMPPLSPGVALDIAYSAAHVVDDDAGSDSVPLADMAAVAWWAAAVLLNSKAVGHAGDIPALAGATPLPGGGDGPSRAYAARAADLRAQYFSHLGIDPAAVSRAESSAGAAFAAVDVAITTANSPPGGRLFRRAATFRRG
jgi:hypothetical protein